MKKTLFILLIVFSITFLFLTACAGNTNQSTPPKAESNNDGGNENNNDPINGFTLDEKSMINEFGFELPFLSNLGYTIKYCGENEEKSGIHFSAIVNSIEEFNTYRILYSKYAYHGTNVDENGITHHSYYTDGFYIDLTCYSTKAGVKIEVCIKIDNDGTIKNPTENENGDCDVEFEDGT